jgi:hypothetical protein
MMSLGALQPGPFGSGENDETASGGAELRVSRLI